MAAAAAALVAIHAVRSADLPRLQLAGLDRSRGQLTIRRTGRDHTVFLDELSLRLLTHWIAERHRRWPANANPHLLVSRRTAMHPAGPPVSTCCLRGLFAKTGVMPGRLRADQLLDEAAHTADPVHLMRVFGLSKATAINYVKTGHPERFTIDPTQP